MKKNQSQVQGKETTLGERPIRIYIYEALNRLIHATGKAKNASYDMAMTFGRMSEPLTKIQKVDSTNTAKSYNFAYKYEDSNHPTAPTQIGNDHYTYDANGNPTLVTNDSTNTTREMYWDEDNRLMVLSDNGKTSRYTYNAAGERIMKSYGTMEGVYINGAPQGITFHETDNFTLYPASIISINKNRFTKHYFIGDKRIASRIGTGLFNNVYGRNGSYVTAGQQDYAERMNQIQKQKEAYYKQQGIAPGVPTEKGAYGDPENTGVGYNAVLTELGNHDVPQGWIQTPRPNTTPNTNPGPPVSWNDPSNPDDPQAGYGYMPNDTTKEETFFYHSDHLGSTSYITDDHANITQYDAYLPYGELLVDEHSSSEELPYKFNGKELDQETGLYYYGARYMNPITSLWYGVDALTEKYPTIGGYVYCAGNSVRLIDPDGKAIHVANKTSYEILLSSLPVGARSIIKLDRNQYINLLSVEKAYNKYQTKNLDILRCIVTDSRVVDFDATANSYTYKNPDGKIEEMTFTEPSRTNTYRELMDAFVGSEADKQSYSQILIQSGIKDEIEVTGNFGATLRPADQQEPYPGGQISPSDNFKVLINPHLTPKEKAKNVGHELFGHLYFYLVGKDPRHGGATQSVNGNIELEQHIQKRENESIENFNNQ